MNTIAEISNVIELSVAPVFLLAGIAGFLGVLSGRLSRITDRLRVLEDRNSQIPEIDCTTTWDEEIKILIGRIGLINTAIRLCTCSALLVCLVICSLFVGYYLLVDLSPVIGLLFIGAMLILLTALITFMREVGIATHSVSRFHRSSPVTNRPSMDIKSSD